MSLQLTVFFKTLNTSNTNIKGRTSRSALSRVYIAQKMWELDLTAFRAALRAAPTEAGDEAQFQLDPWTLIYWRPRSWPEKPRSWLEREPLDDMRSPKWLEMPLSYPTERPDLRDKSLLNELMLAWNCWKTMVWVSTSQICSVMILIWINKRLPFSRID